MGFFSKKKKNKIVQKSWERRGSIARSSIERREEKKRERKFSRFLFWLLLVIFFGICAYLLLFSPFLDIDKISVEGNQAISSTAITSVVEKSLEGRYLGYLPQKNYFMASEKNISSAIKNNFNNLEVESVEKKFPKTISIKVTERKAELVWCSAGVCYFADKNGLLYGGAAGTEEELRAGNFLVVVDDSASPVDIGKTKIDPDYIAFIEAVSGMVRDDLKLDIVESCHTPGMASQEISMMTGEGWILKISSEYSVDEAKKIIQTLFGKELNDEMRKNLDYLDLRVKNKIYYKLKQEGENGSAQ